MLDSVDIFIPNDINYAYDNLDINFKDMMAKDDVMEYLQLDMWWLF